MVTIDDASGNPVEAATVEGEWSGLTSKTASGDTDVNGQATFKSQYVKRASGTFKFCVTNVTKEGWTYDSKANAETCDSITV